MERLFWICLAGAAGTATRYLVGLWTLQRFGPGFPIGTLIVNLVGCFAIAVVMHTALTLSWSPTLRSALTIGFLGGFTTYSSFNYETTLLARNGAAMSATLNLFLTIVGGWLAGWSGLIVARQWLGR